MGRKEVRDEGELECCRHRYRRPDRGFGQERILLAVARDAGCEENIAGDRWAEAVGYAVVDLGEVGGGRAR